MRRGSKEYFMLPTKMSTSLPKLSLCIPTMRRWDFLHRYLPDYLTNPYIGEIVICDETGEDASRIREAFSDPRVKVHINETRLGAYLNKYKVVSLAENEWVCLMDSDNFAPISYFDAWSRFLNGRAPEENECFLPSRALPNFNYTQFTGIPTTAENFKDMWKKPGSDAAFNTGNYILSKSAYMKAVTTPDLLKYESECHALDVQFRNYFLLMNGAIFHFVPGMEYSHVIHDGSYYLATCSIINRRPFDSLFE